MKARYTPLILLLFMVVFAAFGQKPVVITDKEGAIKEAQRQLADLATGEGELARYCAEHNIKGEFVMDLTLQGKGKLLTIFMVSSTTDEMKYQNMLKNKLMEVQFENIKLPKNERAKFRYTLTF